MMHGGGWELMDAVVLAAAGFAAVFFAAWLASPSLRTWIERPKYRFQANVQDYDLSQRAELPLPDGRGSVLKQPHTEPRPLRQPNRPRSSA